jgi:hypothetical protein
MVRIPEGTFLMGSPLGASAEERPMHEVAIAAFFFDRTEVTMNAYAACVTAGACTPTKDDNPFCNVRFEGRGDHPVNCIDWDQAVAYCASLGKRLPTEREWEYAARGGAERRTYSWGEADADSTRACYMHAGGSCPVGSFAPGAFGLLDVNGNVWEWTSSWFGSYPDEPEKGLFKVYRGGSWSRRFPKWLRNELRNRYRKGQHSASLGVRCAKTVEPLVCPPQHAAEGGACVRIEGVPACEPGFAWRDGACAPAGRAATSRPAPPGGDEAPAAATAPSSAPRAYDDTDGIQYVRTRTPQHDPGCQRNWPSTPAAYRWDGGTFHSRNGPIAAAGCNKRDMGRTWTSACCKP